jgi:DNA-binding NtrC family response regulator
MSLAQAREAAEKRAIEAALLRHRYRLGEAAQDLGVSRATLSRLMVAYGLREMIAPGEEGLPNERAEAHE